MSPFDVEFGGVADQDLGSLLTYGASLGYSNPTVRSVSAMSASRRRPGNNPAEDLVDKWQLIDQRADQNYRWPKYLEEYPRYEVYSGITRNDGTVHISLGWAERTETWGRDRAYVVAFLSETSPQIPLVEFLEADNYAKTGELLAVIRGSDGGRRMYGPGDALPQVYEQHFRTELYCDRISAKGVWNKMVVIAHKGDARTILNHALVQARRRGDI